jgi:hypothetical protein
MSESQTPQAPDTLSQGTSAPSDPIQHRLVDELFQRPITRQKLIRQIEENLAGRAVVTFFTSFHHQVIIEDSDADMLESMLQCVDTGKGLCLILNSPGGDALAAERIIRVCRVYSKDDFVVLVPKAAKSAATMIALGSQGIYMGKTAELGPIDPQIIQQVGDRTRYMPAHAIITSYEQLLDQATNLPAGAHIEPFLLQLGRFYASEIEEIRKLRDLSKDIATRSLETGMFKGKGPDAIEKCVKLFTDWDRTLTHGRAIYPEEVIDHGLNVEVIDPTEERWEPIFELYIRSDYFVSSSQACKTVEAAHSSLSVPPPAYASPS